MCMYVLLQSVQSINKARAERGWRPIGLATVDLIGASSQDKDAPKLSSSELRAGDAS